MLTKIHSNNLIAYRFSAKELKKMLELKEILQSEELNFKFEIDRFPEVYLKSMEDELSNNSIIEDKDKQNGKIDLYKYVNSNDFNIDKLGVYKISNTKKGSINETEEGIIILYEDIIKVFAKCKGIKEEDLRLKVLLHELGHWVSHWPLANKSNWKIGYNTLHKKTNEAIAQFISYKLVENENDLKVIFKAFNYKKDSPYLLYENLISQTTSQILNKIVDLRKYHYLNDDCQYIYLADESLNNLRNPIVNHLKTCLNYFGNNSFSNICDYKLNKKSVQISKLLNKEAESFKESLKTLQEISRILHYVDIENELEFTWEWSINYKENIGHNNPVLSDLTIYNEEYVKNCIKSNKDEKKEKLGSFIAYEKHVNEDEEKKEITLIKLVVPIPPNPENQGISGCEIIIYKNSGIVNKIKHEPSEIDLINKKAPLIFRFMEVGRKTKTASRLGDLGL
jgi:hypothetical protein